MRGFLLATLCLAAGCNLVTDFTLGRAAETSDARCSDGVDNDGDGLTDCQDWKCLDQKSCCTLDRVLFQDTFDGPACSQQACDAPGPPCSAIDSALWQPWGQPLPILCEGGLAPRKAEQCYDVGVIGRMPLAMHAGLKVRAKLIGRPEQAGRLEVGLTPRQIVGGSSNCSPVAEVRRAASLRQVHSAGGWQVVATFDDGEVGSSSEVTNDQPHEVGLEIDGELRVSFTLDGTRFATSPAEQPLPPATIGFVYLQGRGLAARFGEVRVTDGTQCESPAAWAPAVPPVTLDGVSDHGTSFDSYEVYNPSAVVQPSGVAALYYGGCANGSLDRCDSYVAFGRSTETAPGQFTRALANPVVFDVIRNPADLAILRGEPGPDVHGYLTTVFSTSARQVIYRITAPGGGAFGNVVPGVPLVLVAGEPGSWDDSEVCCASALQRDGQILMWYAGHSQRDPIWRIGLARSIDDTTFDKDPANPVVSEGARDTFDARGAGEPEVIYDPVRGLYRMWYRADAFLGQTTIGYATSTDGVAWHKFPGNPVVKPTDFGLDTLASPTVLLEPSRLRLWVQGTELAHPSLRIYGFQNEGRPSE